MDTTLPRIVVAEAFRPEVLQRLRQHAQVIELRDTNPESLIAAVSSADALLVRMRAAITARVIEAAPRLRVIASAVDLGELLRRSDVLSINLPRGERYIGLIGAKELAQMQSASYVVSTSRGVVDCRALAEALKTHRIAGAALDTLDPEELTAE